MKLIYEKSRMTVQVGDKVTIGGMGDREEVTVNFFREPHKPDSSGKVVVEFEDGDTRQYYVGVIGAEWIEREDRGEGPALMRNGKALKTVPDGSPRRMADGKNAYRKMNAEQRATFAQWIVHGEDAPEMDFFTAYAFKQAQEAK